MPRKLKVLDLFCGDKSVAKICKRYPSTFDVMTLDFDAKFKPDICCDILLWDYKKDLKWKTVDIIIAGPVCTEFSKLKLYSDKRDLAKGGSLVKKTLEIIKHYDPKFWIIENPKTSALSDQPYMRGLPFYDVTYCMYGFEYKKPTRLWTNITTFKPKFCHADCPHVDKLGRHRFSLGFVNEPHRMAYQTRVPKTEWALYPPRLVTDLLRCGTREFFKRELVK